MGICATLFRITCFVALDLVVPIFLTSDENNIIIILKLCILTNLYLKLETTKEKCK